MATFKEAWGSFTKSANIAFNRGVSPTAMGAFMGKDSISSQMGFDPFGIGDRTLFGENSLFTGGANANSNNSSIREQTDYMRMSSQRQEELLKQLTIQNEALIAEAQETNRSYLYGD